MLSNFNELLASRADIFNAADALVRKAQSSGKDLAGDELRTYQGLIASLQTLNDQVDQRSQGRAMPPETWRLLNGSGRISPRLLNARGGRCGAFPGHRARPCI